MRRTPASRHGGGAVAPALAGGCEAAAGLDRAPVAIAVLAKCAQAIGLADRARFEVGDIVSSPAARRSPSVAERAGFTMESYEPPAGRADQAAHVLRAGRSAAGRRSAASSPCFQLGGSSSKSSRCSILTQRIVADPLTTNTEQRLILAVIAFSMRTYHTNGYGPDAATCTNLDLHARYAHTF
jgi:hypothetical protein